VMKHHDQQEGTCASIHATNNNMLHHSSSKDKLVGHYLQGSLSAWWFLGQGPCKLAFGISLHKKSYGNRMKELDGT